jgi:hypothetical protein
MATFPQCQTCKWWGLSYSGACDRVEQPVADPDARFELWATAADDSDLLARLYVGPEFGCALHEEKECEACGSHNVQNRGAVILARRPEAERR